jgi:hypothetical protein
MADATVFDKALGMTTRSRSSPHEVKGEGEDAFPTFSPNK